MSSTILGLVRLEARGLRVETRPARVVGMLVGLFVVGERRDALSRLRHGGVGLRERVDGLLRRLPRVLRGLLGRLQLACDLRRARRVLGGVERQQVVDLPQRRGGEEDPRLAQPEVRGGHVERGQRAGHDDIVWLAGQYPLGLRRQRVQERHVLDAVREADPEHFGGGDQAERS